MSMSSAEILSKITVFNKYARYREVLGRRETFEEIVDRNKSMHLQKFKDDPEVCAEIEHVYENFVKTKKILPSMRSLQFGGKPIEVSPNRIYNCCFMPVDDFRAFSEAMFLLLGGTGVGYSVQKKHVAKMPAVRKPLKSRRFLVADSIEGWADAVKALMRAYMEGLSLPKFDFRDVREKGMPLVTSGGSAPGPQPLKDCLHNIKKILDGKADGEHLTTLESHDIMCFIADAVLAGGIRRAACISLFDMDDEDMLTCKFGNWWELNPQRGRSNNSAVIVRHKIKKKAFFNLWDRIKASGSGEPGFYFTNNADWGTNPCCEIALKPFQFCVAGDTRLITKKGIVNIKDAIGAKTEVWNGEEWSQVVPYKTGDSDDLYRVFFNDGSFLDATDHHKFLVKNRFEKQYKEVTTLKMIDMLQTEKYQFYVPRANIKYKGGKSYEDSYESGFVLGDGYCKRNKVQLQLFGADKDIVFNKVTKVKSYSNYRETPFLHKELGLDLTFCKKLKYEKGLPTEIFTWNEDSILKFVAGWADADGSQASNGIRIYGKECKIRDLQLLLTKVGINSSVNLAQDKGVITNLGVRKNAVYYVQITETYNIPCQRLVCNNKQKAKCKGKNQIIKGIKKLNGKHESFCLTEDKLHQCVFNNVLTKQCNLCEINMGDISSQEDLNERAKAASFVGTLQGSYTDFHYLRDIWKTTTEKDALIGVSGTGIASGEFKKYSLTEASEVVVAENIRVADKIGINHAARATCVKPAGTSSMVLGQSSGIHGWHAKYYIRRMRTGKNEALYLFLKQHHPELVEDDFMKPKADAVISIPIEAPKGAILRTESPLELLERVKLFHSDWVKPGHTKGDNTHNVSATISIKEDEWEEVGKWMWANKDFYNGLSVLPWDGGTYVQAPFEEISSQKYHAMLKHLKGVDLTKVKEDGDYTDLSGEIACAGGVCDIQF